MPQLPQYDREHISGFQEQGAVTEFNHPEHHHVDWHGVEAVNSQDSRMYMQGFDPFVQAGSRIEMERLRGIESEYRYAIINHFNDDVNGFQRASRIQNVTTRLNQLCTKALTAELSLRDIGQVWEAEERMFEHGGHYGFGIVSSYLRDQRRTNVVPRSFTVAQS